MVARKAKAHSAPGVALRMVVMLAALAPALAGGCGSKRIITVSTQTETIESIDGSRLIKHRLGPYPDALEREFGRRG